MTTTTPSFLLDICHFLGWIPSLLFLLISHVAGLTTTQIGSTTYQIANPAISGCPLDPNHLPIAYADTPCTNSLFGIMETSIFEDDLGIYDN